MRTVSSLVTLLALAAPTFAQQEWEEPKPPEQLNKFGMVLGAWNGSGTSQIPDTDESAPWNASMHVDRILDGFFVRERIQISVGLPTPVVYWTIYGFDVEAQKYMAFTFGNDGESMYTDYEFPERGVLMMRRKAMMNGKPAIGRSMWQMNRRRELSYTSEAALGAGAMAKMVEGSFSRAEDAAEPDSSGAFAMSEVAPEMKRLAKHLAGNYTMKGAMTMAPGMPEMKISGTDSMSTMFGGHALMSKVVGHAEGDDNPYHGRTIMMWNAEANCYRVVWFDNMGMMGEGEARFEGDDKLVMTWAGLQMGQPTVMGSTMHFGDGGLKHVVGYSIVGSNAPTKSFEGHYERAK